jgi:hypothetical protein
MLAIYRITNISFVFVKQIIRIFRDQLETIACKYFSSSRKKSVNEHIDAFLGELK